MRKLTKRELQEKIAGILARMRAEATPFDDGSEEAKAKRRERGRRDKAWFLRTYLPHYFDHPFCEMHYDLMGLAELRNELIFIAAPREHGKSVICSLGDPIHETCHSLMHFYIQVSDIEDLASDFLLFIKIELEENERIKMDFGELLRPGQEAKDFRTTNGIRFKARGRGQRIRGLRNRQYRPDRVRIDDLENDQNVRNPRIVRSSIDWIKGAVLGSLADDFNLIMVGNLLTRRCVLAQFIFEEEDGRRKYIGRVYRIYKEDGMPLWPEVWPTERIEQRKRQMGSTVFLREMMNDPRDEEGPFQVIYYYTIEELAGKILDMAGFIDPSVGSGESNDYKAVVAVGRDCATGDIYVRYAFIKRCSISRMIQASYGMHEDCDTRTIGIEDNSWQKLLFNDFDRAAEEYKYHLPLKGVTHTTNKESRIISGLESLVERGKIKFLKGHSDQDLLVEQLQSLLSPTVNDDGPDALEGAVSLVNRMARKAEIATARRRQAVRMVEAY